MPETRIFAIGDKVRVITHRFDTKDVIQYGDIGEVEALLPENREFDYTVRFPLGARYYSEFDLTRIVDLKMTPPDMELDEIHRAQELMR